MTGRVSGGEWFVIKSGERAGLWHLSGWMTTSIKGEDLSISGGWSDPSRGWLGLGICPRCFGLVLSDDKHAYGDQQWAHEDWHHRTDYPHPDTEGPVS